MTKLLGLFSQSWLLRVTRNILVNNFSWQKLSNSWLFSCFERKFSISVVKTNFYVFKKTSWSEMFWWKKHLFLFHDLWWQILCRRARNWLPVSTRTLRENRIVVSFLKNACFCRNWVKVSDWYSENTFVPFQKISFHPKKFREIFDFISLFFPDCDLFFSLSFRTRLLLVTRQTSGESFFWNPFFTHKLIQHLSETISAAIVKTDFNLSRRSIWFKIDFWTLFKNLRFCSDFEPNSRLVFSKLISPFETNSSGKWNFRVF